jgi:hypothetical protein
MTERTVGTWFFEPLGDGWVDLLQQRADGPHLVGEISEETASFICGKLNDKSVVSGEVMKP